MLDSARIYKYSFIPTCWLTGLCLVYHFNKVFMNKNNFTITRLKVNGLEKGSQNGFKNEFI